MSTTLEKLAKEAIDLKRKYDMLSSTVSDLDAFMREAVMVMIDIINMLHSTIDDLEERADIIEAVILGKEPIEVLKRRSRILAEEARGPKPPPTPPPVVPQPPSQPTPTPQSQQAISQTQQTPEVASPPPQQTTPAAPAPSVPQTQQISVPPPPPVAPIPSQQQTPAVAQQSQPASSPAQAPAPSAPPGPGPSQQAPRPPALPARMQLIFELRRALEERRKRKS